MEFKHLGLGLLLTTTLLYGGTWHLNTGEILGYFSPVSGHTHLVSMDKEQGFSEGWSTVEYDGEKPFRWITAERVSLHLNGDKTNRSLLIECRTTPWARAAGQTVEIRWNGKHAGTFRPQVHWKRFAIALPPGEGETITIEVHLLIRPSRYDPENNDTRLLGIAVDLLRLSDRDQDPLITAPPVDLQTVPRWDSRTDHLVLPPGARVEGTLPFPAGSRFRLTCSGTLTFTSESRIARKGGDITYSLPEKPELLTLQNPTSEPLSCRLRLAGKNRPAKSETRIVITATDIREADFLLLDTLRSKTRCHRITLQEAGAIIGPPPLTSSPPSVLSRKDLALINGSRMVTFEQWYGAMKEVRKFPADSDGPDWIEVELGDLGDSNLHPVECHGMRLSVGDRGPFNLPLKGPLSVTLLAHRNLTTIPLVWEDATSYTRGIRISSLKSGDPEITVERGRGWVKSPDEQEIITRTAEVILRSSRNGDHMVTLTFEGTPIVHPASKGKIRRKRLESLNIWAQMLTDDHRDITFLFYPPEESGKTTLLECRNIR